MSTDTQLLPWRKEHSLDADGARALLEELFPQLAPVTLRFIGEGWDSEAYEINDEVIVRLPKRQNVADRLEREIRLLELLAPQVALSVPRFEWLGDPSARYPFRFAGYRKLPGVPGIDCPEAWSRLDQATIARQLGEFLSTLHAISLDDARACGLEDTDNVDWSHASLWDNADAHIDRVRLVNAHHAHRLREWLLHAQPLALPDVPHAPTHADLGAEHIMVDIDSRTLSGIIDWGDVCMAPAACDFVGPFAWFGREFLERITEHYRASGVKEAYDWIRQGAVSAALSHIRYGVESEHRKYLALGLHSLEQALAAL